MIEHCGYAPFPLWDGDALFVRRFGKLSASAKDYYLYYMCQFALCEGDMLPALTDKAVSKDMDMSMRAVGDGRRQCESSEILERVEKVDKAFIFKLPDSTNLGTYAKNVSDKDATYENNVSTDENLRKKRKSDESTYENNVTYAKNVSNGAPTYENNVKSGETYAKNVNNGERGGVLEGGG